MADTEKPEGKSALLPILAVALAFMSNVSVSDATGHLASWWNAIPLLPDAPTWLSGRTADAVVTGLGALIFVFWLAKNWWPKRWRRKPRMEELDIQITPRPPSVIPIAISEVGESSFLTYPFSGRAEPGIIQDAPLLMFGEVRIVNISRVDPVNLDIRLRLTADGGWNMPLSPGQTDWIGRRLDQTEGANYQRERGAAEPRYLENPIHLGPGEAISGQLVFFLLAVNDELRAKFLQVQLRNGFEKRLEVSDLVSGAKIAFDVPGSYRGSERTT